MMCPLCPHHVIESTCTIIKGECSWGSVQPSTCVHNRSSYDALFNSSTTSGAPSYTAHECRAAHHYYVTATNGSDCPPTFPCHPLNYYVQDAASYFTSNTVEFLPGLHELNYTGHVFITLVGNLTLIGTDSNVNTFTRCNHSDSIVFCKTE